MLIKELFNLKDSKAISKKIHEINKQYNTLSPIKMYIPNFPKENNIKPFLEALLDDNLSSILVDSIVCSLLNKIKDEEKRFNVLNNCIHNSDNGLYVCIILIIELDHYLTSNTPIVIETHLKELKKLIVNKINTNIKNQKLWNHPYLRDILYIGSEWDNTETIKNNVTSYIKENDNALTFIKNLNVSLGINDKKLFMYTDKDVLVEELKRISKNTNYENKTIIDLFFNPENTAC